MSTAVNIQISEARADSLQGRVRRRTRDKSVRDLPVTSKIKIGQIIVEQPVCGIIFSFPAAVWPEDVAKQRAWVERLTPWWDIGEIGWTPTAQRLRESCVKAINTLTRPGGSETAHRERRDESPNGEVSDAGPLTSELKPKREPGIR